MTIAALFEHITEQLQKAGCDSPAFDACCLLEDFAGLPHAADPRSCFTKLTAEQEQTLLASFLLLKQSNFGLSETIYLCDGYIRRDESASMTIRLTKYEICVGRKPIMS